jgi:hypothetical protein
MMLNIPPKSIACLCAGDKGVWITHMVTLSGVPSMQKCELRRGPGEPGNCSELM